MNNAGLLRILCEYPRYDLLNNLRGKKAYRFKSLAEMVNEVKEFSPNQFGISGTYFMVEGEVNYRQLMINEPLPKKTSDPCKLVYEYAIGGYMSSSVNDFPKRGLAVSKDEEFLLENLKKQHQAHGPLGDLAQVLSDFKVLESASTIASSIPMVSELEINGKKQYSIKIRLNKNLIGEQIDPFNLFDEKIKGPLFMYDNEDKLMLISFKKGSPEMKKSWICKREYHYMSVSLYRTKSPINTNSNAFRSFSNKNYTKN